MGTCYPNTYLNIYSINYWIYVYLLCESWCLGIFNQEDKMVDYAGYVSWYTVFYEFVKLVERENERKSSEKEFKRADLVVCQFPRHFYVVLSHNFLGLKMHTWKDHITYIYVQIHSWCIFLKRWGGNIW